MAARRWRRWRRRRLTRGCSVVASLAAILSDLVSGLAAVGPLLQLAREVQSSELSNWYQGQGCAALRQPVPPSVVRQQCGAAPPPVVGGRQTCTLHCESHICSGFCRHNSIVQTKAKSVACSYVRTALLSGFSSSYYYRRGDAALLPPSPPPSPV
jgi:hypothetical protein